MMQSCWLRQTAFAGALGLAVLALGISGNAHAQQDGTIENDNSIWNLEKRIWNGFIRSFGLRSGDEPVIDYRERSPLVVPPSRDLPPPQAKSAAKSPAWPNDPDVARRKVRTDAKKIVGNDRSRVLDQESRPMTPAELNVPGGKPTAASGPPSRDDDLDERPPTPNDGYFNALFSMRAWGFGGYAEETGTFRNEPPRAALTAPPAGYQTPSSEHPYGTTRRIERTPNKETGPGRN